MMTVIYDTSFDARAVVLGVMGLRLPLKKVIAGHLLWNSTSKFSAFST